VIPETTLQIRLSRLELKGFKTFRELVFEPRALNVLIGANGVGKSNFISFFRLMSWAMASSGNLQLEIARRGGASRLLHDGPAVTPQIEVELAFETEKGTNEYAAVLEYAAGDTLIFASEQFRFSGTNKPVAASWQSLGAGHRESGLIGLSDRGNKTAKAIRFLIQRCIVAQFHNTSQTSRMLTRWRVNDNRYLKEDGGNLASVLLRLQQNEALAYRRIVDTLRLIVPFFGDFELNPDNGTVPLAWREIGSDVVFDASQASDGMLRTMALITLLGQPEKDLPSILVLDEPELGLHPYGVNVIGAMIKRASKYV
jgi:predicted ATPase